MDAPRFDALTRAVSSRRTALGGVVGASLAALLGLLTPAPAAAHNPLPRCRRIRNKRKRKQCIKAAKRHNARRHCPCRGGSCSGGQCICPANTHQCVPGLCCPNEQACPGGTTCGACPATPNPCPPHPGYVCGVSSADATCVCVTSVQGTTTCSPAAGRCITCATDAECTTELGAPGVCVNLVGCNVCSQTGGVACLVAGCVNWCKIDADCTAPQVCVGASGDTPGTCQ